MRIFDDRTDAARALARALAAYDGCEPLVLAIPRGGVPIGRVIADALHGTLDVVLVRKLGAPGSPEFAVGAVDETGWTYVADYAPRAGASEAYLARERAAQLELLAQRRLRYTGGREPASAEGKVAIVVDDGLATGATMVAALHAVRSRNPAKLVCAVPVAAPSSLEQVRPHADDVVCLASPEDFMAVGACYRSFPQVSDEEVIAALGTSRAP